MNPFPCSFTTMKVNEKEKMFKIYEVEKLNEEFEGEIGAIVKFIKNKGPVVKVNNGAVILTSVKPENKKVLAGQDLINGNYFSLNDRFEVK
jgi:methionyl-tRNA formyltransferase